MKLYIGCSGFYNSSWKSHFYPEKLPQRKWFEYYSSQFNTLEINSSFYRYPKRDLLKKWVNESPEGFILAIKAPRTVTHYRRFNNSERQLDDFYKLIEEGLTSKLGPVLFQLPADFTYTEERLEQIITSLNPRFLNVAEFRDTSWMRPDVRIVLQKSGIVYCNVSHPTLPDDPVISGPILYIRFHGVPELYLSGYTDGHLNEWAEKIKRARPEKCFIYFNNTITPVAIANARTLSRLLN